MGDTAASADIRKVVWNAPISERTKPLPHTDAWDWQMRARCRDEDPTLFFHPDGERGAARRARQRAADAVCIQCPVRVACREHSLSVPERYGTWGGISEDDRSRLLGLARRRRTMAG